MPLILSTKPGETGIPAISYTIGEGLYRTSEQPFQELINSLTLCLNGHRRFFTFYKGTTYAAKSTARETAIANLNNLSSTLEEMEGRIYIAAIFAAISDIIDTYVAAVTPYLKKDWTISKTHDVIHGYYPTPAMGSTHPLPYQPGILDIYNSALMKTVKRFREDGFDIPEERQRLTVTVTTETGAGGGTDHEAPTTETQSTTSRPGRQ